MFDCLGHPTNRRLGHGPANRLDRERLIEATRRLDVATEVNGNPYRMDANEVLCRTAREYRVPVVVNTAPHAPAHLPRRELDLATARRGWIEPRHVINTLPWETIAARRRERLRRHRVVVPADVEWREVDEPAPPPESDPTLASVAHWPAEQAQAAATREDPEALRLALASDALDDALAALGDNPLQVASGLLLDGAAK